MLDATRKLPCILFFMKLFIICELEKEIVTRNLIEICRFQTSSIQIDRCGNLVRRYNSMKPTETDCFRMNLFVTSEIAFFVATVCAAARDWEIKMLLRLAVLRTTKLWITLIRHLKVVALNLSDLCNHLSFIFLYITNEFLLKLKREIIPPAHHLRNIRTWLSWPLCYCYLPHNTAHYGMYSWMRLYCNCRSIGCSHFYLIYRWNTFAGSIVAWPATSFCRNSVEHQRKSCRHYFASSHSFDRICRRRFRFRWRFHWFGCHCFDCIGVEMAAVARICVKWTSE